MIKKKSKRDIDKSFQACIDEKILKENEAEYLNEIMINSLARLEEKKDIHEKIDVDFLTGKEPFDENILRKKENECYEIQVDVKGRQAVRDTLLNRKVIKAGKRGLYIPSAINQFFFKLLKGSLKKINLGLIPVLRRSHDFIVNTALALQTHCEDRTSFANQVGYKIYDESSIIFANTPAILDPFEFLKEHKESTKEFVYFLERTENIIHYVWYEPTILSLIRKQLNIAEMTEEKLKTLYFNHFKKHGLNPNVLIYYGDSSGYTKGDKSVQLISEKLIMLGFREKGKIQHGTMIHRGKLKRYLGILPMVGEFLNLPAEIMDNIFGKKTYYEIVNCLNRDVSCGKLIKLRERTEPDIEAFINDLFSKALIEQV